jgi:hypothetical protein
MTRMRGPRHWLQRLKHFSNFFGLMPPLVGIWRNIPRFVRDARAYRRAPGTDRFPLVWSEIHPRLGDYGASAGSAGGHYFHQDLWAARKIHAARPARHVDIGSRVDGFVAHVLTFMPVHVVDIRPLSSDVAGLTFLQGDMCRLDGVPSGSVESLSCLHAIEHVGLGRYGDPIDPGGWATALGEFSRVLAPEGRLYLGTPIGRERVHFNSERIFAPRTVVGALPGLTLVSFCAVDDAGGLVEDAGLDTFADATYSCGLFEFTKS